MTMNEVPILTNDEISVGKILDAYEERRRKSSADPKRVLTDGTPVEFETNAVQQQDKLLAIQEMIARGRRAPVVKDGRIRKDEKGWPPSIYVEKVKPNGKIRSINMLSNTAHVAALACFNKLKAKVILPEHFFAVEAKGAEHALGAFQNFRASSDGDFWLNIVDIRGFFDHVPHGELRRRFREHGLTKKDIRLLMALLTIPGVDQQNHRKVLQSFDGVGISQGNPLSAFSAAMTLLDLSEAASRCVFMIIYVDDILLAYPSEDTARRGFNDIQQYLSGIGYDLKDDDVENCLVRPNEEFVYLGQKLKL